MRRFYAKLFSLTVVFAASPSAQNYPAAPSKGYPPPPPANSETACPWLTEGSAANALGGKVRVILSLTSFTQGTCTFVKTEDPQDQLKVFVGAANVPSCPAGSAHVTGIGVEASRCRLPLAHQGVTQMISSRVREINLAVTVSTSKSGDPAEAAIEQIAEQVAGNLF
jgi:hypothetical protein